MALAALKSFVVLYLVIGLDYKLQTSSLIIGGVSVVILVGAALAGKLGDRFGRLRVAAFAATVYGLGFIVPMATTNRAALGVSIIPIALGGGTLMTLAYAILMPLMPEDQQAALTGFYSLSRGIGLTTGPLLAGALIYLTRHGPFTATQGYQAMWIVCGAAALASVVFVRAMRRASRDREELKRL
jgi:MFS family permease